LGLVAGEQLDVRSRRRRVDDMVDRRGGRRDARRQYVLAEQRVHERRLAMVELTEHDEMKALSLELGDPRIADVASERPHADAFGDVGELLKASDDLALGLLVMLEQDHSPLLEHADELGALRIYLGQRGLAGWVLAHHVGVERRACKQPKRLYALGYVWIR